MISFVRTTMDEPEILVVEDDPRDAALIQHTLRAAGITNAVRVVSTAAEAIACLDGEAQEGLLKAAFIDLFLPGQSGHEVLTWIQANEKLQGLIRIVLTGSDNPEDLKRAHELGANCYLRKPLTVEQLTSPVVNLRMLLAADSALV